MIALIQFGLGVFMMLRAASGDAQEALLALAVFALFEIAARLEGGHK